MMTPTMQIDAGNSVPAWTVAFVALAALACGGAVGVLLALGGAA